jgi:riboflavin biosynthesis pyrimidine reductase
VIGPSPSREEPRHARQAIAAGLVDEIDLQVNPVILGSGERLLDGFAAGTPTMELVRVLEAPGVAHVRYRVMTR